MCKKYLGPNATKEIRPRGPSPLINGADVRGANPHRCGRSVSDTLSDVVDLCGLFATSCSRRETTAATILKHLANNSDGSRTAEEAANAWRSELKTWYVGTRGQVYEGDNRERVRAVTCSKFRREMRSEMKHRLEFLCVSARKWEHERDRFLRVIDTKTVFKRKEKKAAKVQEGTDGVGKHFFLGVLSENGTSEKAEQWVGRLDAFAPGESSKMKNHACASLRNILRSTVIPKTAKAD